MTETPISLIVPTPAIQFGLTGWEAILQNVRTILATPLGSIPLMRWFGVDWAFLDSPVPASQAQMTAEIMRAVELGEPRVVVSRVDWDPANVVDGQIRPVVVVRPR